MDHFYTNIKGWSKFLDVYKNAVEQAQDGAQFVEVGCWKGRSAAYMAVEIANSGKDIKFYCVDHFLGSDEEAHKNAPEIIEGKLYDVFCQNIEPVKQYINILRMSSITAAACFPDQFLDFVFLDASHDLESVRADLAAWMPKMKPKSIIAGDNWKWSGVHTAVREWFGKEEVEVIEIPRGDHWRVRLSPVTLEQISL